MSNILQPPETRPAPSGDSPDTRWVGRFTGRSVLVAIPLLAVLVLVGCRSPVTTGATGGPPSITANPNPVPAGAGKATTTITWTTGNGSVGQVYVADGKREKLFATGAEGSKEAPWIQAGITHEFSLYAGQEHAGKPLASVTVTRSAH
jgi:hypothetical protein